MQKVILTKGLPASGKTTWSKQYCKENKNWKRVNKDDLRFMLDDSQWTPENEEFIVRTRDRIIIEAVTSGINVIVDDTNLADKHLHHIKKLVENLAEVEIKDFTDVPIATCLERDNNRTHGRVGEKIIYTMCEKFLKGGYATKVTS